ncbi:MAG TPA: DUF5060 domain-containing protein, partial [Thermoanaerobaculia bacterium]|nr:DUF5060 domain-containing protein [Thermoanaerobaculia bacterium]
MRTEATVSAALAVALLLAGAVSLPAAVSTPAVPRFGTAEVVLRASQTFDSRQGSPNPFDVTLTATVTAPSGKIYQADGFFDGDGAGGPVGNVFKVRIYAAETGTWSWSTASSRAELAGRTGTFTCAGTLPGPFASGPLAVNPRRPHTFRYQEGRPVYLVGKFLDLAAPPVLQYSHTFFSEQLTEADRQAFLDRHLGMGLNKINLYLANHGDYDGVATTPWVGVKGANDKRRFDLARWHMYERWLRRLRDAGLLAHLWFFADDSGFGDLPDADRQRLVRYGMARLSGEVHTLFTLALEWQEGWTPAEVQSHSNFLQQHNPWDRLVSVHGVPGPFDFPAAPWADYMDVQAGNEVGPSAVYAAGVLNRALAAKPLIQEEFGLGREVAEERRKAWAAFLSGAAGSGTGAFLRPLAQFTNSIQFQRLAPAPTVVLAGGAWALAAPGETYVLYLHDGGTVQVSLLGVSGTFEAEWFDPRRGTFTRGADVQGGGIRSFTAPGSGDWTLLLHRPAPPPAPVPAHFHTLRPC